MQGGRKRKRRTTRGRRSNGGRKDGWKEERAGGRKEGEHMEGRIKGRTKMGVDKKKELKGEKHGYRWTEETMWM